MQGAMSGLDVISLKVATRTRRPSASHVVRPAESALRVSPERERGHKGYATNPDVQEHALRDAHRWNYETCPGLSD